MSYSGLMFCTVFPSAACRAWLDNTDDLMGSFSCDLAAPKATILRLLPLTHTWYCMARAAIFGCWNCILTCIQKPEDREFIFNREYHFQPHLHSIADGEFIWTHFTSCSNTVVRDHYTNYVQEKEFGHFLVANSCLGWQERLVRPAAVSKVKTTL